METIETIDLGKHDGFDLEFRACVEDLPLADTFDDTVTDLEELAGKVESGELVYFCARVAAHKNGIELGFDILGACCYNSFQDFVDQKDGYITDMIETAVSEAKDTIEALTE